MTCALRRPRSHYPAPLGQDPQAAQRQAALRAQPVQFGEAGVSGSSLTHV